MNQKTVRIEHHDKVAVVRLDHGVTNAIDVQLVRELAEVLQDVRQDAGVRAMVLGSANDKFFSIGFDIPHLFGLSRKDFTAFYRAFNLACLELYTLPKPVVAALSGHATAGGCILALCCDYRYIAEGRKLIGLNEIKLGVPVPYPADCMLRQLVGARLARDVMDGGEFYPPEEALRIGLVDRILPLDQVLPAAIEKAAALGAHPPEAFGLIKLSRLEMVEAQIRAGLEEREASFVECWYSQETRERLKSTMEKF